MLILSPLPHTDADASARRWMWVRSRDGVSVDTHGEDLSAALPRDSDCVLALPPSDVRWHQLSLPPHPAAKREAVLTGMLDTCVLGEPEHLHAALPAQVQVGEPTWVAVTTREALRDLLRDLQTVGLNPNRIVPLLAPGDAPGALAWVQGDSWRVSLSGPLGVLHIAGAQDSSTLRDFGPDAVAAWQQLRCPSHLAAAVESAWPEHPIQVLSAQTLLLQASASPWNLAQFAFRVSTAQRRTQGLQHAWRQLRHAPAWRPVRSGLVVALLATLVLPPTWAWREHQLQQELRAQARALVQTTFPDIRLVIDPALQMQRAVDDLAKTRGANNSRSLASLLSSLGQLPQARVTDVRWQADQADLHIQGAQLDALQRLLTPLGWQVSAQGPDQWRISPKGRS